MSSLILADSLIKEPDNISRVMFPKGTTKDIVSTILYADNNLGNELNEFARTFPKTKNGLRSIWKFVNTHIDYVADKPGFEKIKSPAYTWKDGFGDCKSMSLFIGAILKELKVPYVYRFAGYGNSEDVTHIYPVAFLNGETIVLDATIQRFNFQEPYSFYYDENPSENLVSSAINKPVTSSCSLAKFAIAAGILGSLFLMNKRGLEC